MNIIYHHRTQGTGAEGVHIAYIIKGLRHLGHVVTVVSPNATEPGQTAGNNPFAEKRGQRQRFFSFLSRHLPQFMFELLEIAYNAVAYGKLKRQFREQPADFIYERHAFFMCAGAKIAQRRKVPLIVEVNEIAGEARVRRQIFVGLARRMERFVFRRAAAIIVVSQFLKDRIVESGIDGNKIHVIPNGADADLFDPSVDAGALRRRFHFEEDTVVTGFIGWFVPWHRLEELIRHFAVVARGKNAALFLVGDGNIRERLREVSEEEGVAKQVIFPGAVKYAQIPEYVALMDICVIPGSNEYRSPIKMFEYMVMGKPVLAPRFHPITSVIDDGVNGLIFDSTDGTQLEAAWRRLLDDPTLRTDLGQRARAKILAQHLWEHNAQKVIDIYKETARGAIEP